MNWTDNIHQQTTNTVAETNMLGKVRGAWNHALYNAPGGGASTALLGYERRQVKYRFLKCDRR